jgi:osmotically inducible lipoprotein OsmB
MINCSHRANLKFKLTQRIYMITLNTSLKTLLLTLSSILMMGCAGMSEQEKATAIGAGVGAIGGSILTGGSTSGTIGGAAVGGVIGHEIKK